MEKICKLTLLKIYLITCASNVLLHILEEKKNAELAKTMKISKKKNSCAENVQLQQQEEELKNVLNMDRNLQNLNVNSAVKLLNGFAGETLIFVSLAIKDNVMEIMFREKRKTNCQSVKVLKNVLLEGIIQQTEMNTHLDAVYVEM